MINDFSKEVTKQIGFYVYRLIDPRNGNTFYVGKGKGNRVFAHMKGALKLAGDEDDISVKIDTIKAIIKEGLEVIHVIHRHGLDENTAFEVEAALIDAYPGLSNEINGRGYGAMNAQQIQKLYGAEIIEEITEKCIIIKVKQEVVDRCGSVYEAVRAAWKLKKSNAEKADYVFAVVNGLVAGVYKDMVWSESPNKRLKFDGVRSPKLEKKYKGKRIPSEFSKFGSANPCQYANC
jgi:hypothetical protein